MLGADLLGFQRRQWADNFLASCQETGHPVDGEAAIVNQGSRGTHVRCYPVPVDAAALSTAARSAPVLAWERHLAETARRRIVRIDRLDPSKNILRGFEAFELLLQRRPDLRDQVHLLALLIPSRQGVPEYQWYGAQVRATAARVASRFPGTLSLHWGQDRDRALAAMWLYDVLLVNPVRDGMNLVAQKGQ